MTFFERNIENIEKGFLGEEIVRDWLKGRGNKFMQIDLIFQVKGKYYLGEVKAQAFYESPPFDGHGLPKWQINDRLDFFKRTKIEPILFVYDLKIGKIFYQSMVTLMEGKQHQTHGKSPRLIFPLENFKVIDV